MRLALRSLGMAGLLVVTLSGCETKVTEISVVCRPGDQLVEPVRWQYTAKADPTVIKQIPRAIDITLHYTGDKPRTPPPVTTYFYRNGGATLRVVSSSEATIPPKGTYTYHVDTGGYAYALTATGRGADAELAFFVVVDGSYFGGLMSPPTCGEYADGHIDVGKAAKVPDLKDKQPLNIAAGNWLDIATLPTAVARIQGPETSTYAFFRAPIALTEIKNETSPPDGQAKQQAEVGVTSATPLFTMTGEPTPDAIKAQGAAQGGKS